MYSNKYEAAVKEKMLMKLEKDRLIAKVENLEISLKQTKNEQDEQAAELRGTSKFNDASTTKSPTKLNDSKQKKATVVAPTPIPQRDRFNPHLNETLEATGAHLTMLKTLKGHLMGVTSLAYNPKKDIVATGSDDTTWKLWSVPNGDLIMSGEGHLDWVGGVEFSPKGNLLATASGDGTVKIWDFANACCSQTFTEHG